MKKQFVTYEIALKLKELGFDEGCFAHYCSDDLITKTAILKSSTMLYYHQNNINPNNQYGDLKCTAPLWQQVIDWFREKHKIHISFPNHYDGWSLDIRDHSNDSSFYSLPNRWYIDYDEARIDAITYAIALYEGQKKNSGILKFRCSCFDEDCNDVKSHQSCYDGLGGLSKADGYCPFLLNTHKN